IEPSGGYHVVPPLIIRNFMPPKTDLVFHAALIAVETTHSAFTVQLSPSEHAQNLSHTNRPSAPIIEEWVSDSEDESNQQPSASIIEDWVSDSEHKFEPNDPQSVPSFVQSSEQVKSPRHSVQPVKAPILDATPKPASPKSNSSSKRKNRKTCFVCRSVDHLIKDCNYHAKKRLNPYQGTMHTGVIKSKMLHLLINTPPAVLTQSKPVSITDVRPVSVVVPKIMVNRPRHTHSIYTKSKSPIRRHITHSPSPKTSNSPSRVTAAQALVVSVVKGKKGKWVWRPKCPHSRP
nr:hypothetical protein [Tanacetum cinerariifolium]